jgi:hypothetical protein
MFLRGLKHARQRMFRRGNRRFDAFRRGAFLAQMQLRDRVVYDLGEVHNRLAFAALVAQHQTIASST